jgi:phosphoribosylformylglycinamidine synthase I
VNAAVVVFPGSNCDADTLHVLSNVVGMNARYVWYADSDLDDVDLVVLPGGFSYGDYLRTGAMAARAPIMRPVRDHAAQGRPVLGICNGFQILLEAGLLPGAMLSNASTEFRCEWTHLRVESTRTPCTAAARSGQVLRLPIAHADGNYVVDRDSLARLQDEDRVVFRYVSTAGDRSPDANPNGSIDDIAGICNAGRNVVGMMPHPERASEAALGGEDGRAIWDSLLAAAGA